MSPFYKTYVSFRPDGWLWYVYFYNGEIDIFVKVGRADSEDEARNEVEQAIVSDKAKRQTDSLEDYLVVEVE